MRRRLTDTELVALVWQYTGTTPAVFAEMTEMEFNLNDDELDVLPAWPYWAKVKFLLLAAQYPNPPNQPH